MEHASFIPSPALAAGLLSLFCGVSTAQTVSPDALSVEAKAIYTADGDVLLRWAPSNYKTWLWGRDSGFVLQRMTLEAADTILDPVAMNASIITVELAPKTQSAWEAAMALDSAAVGTAAGACFGDGFIVTPPGDSGSIFTAYNLNTERDNRFGLSLFAADISTLAAQVQNLYYKDENAAPGCQYSYLVRPRGITAGHIVRHALVSVRTDDPYEAPPPAEFSAAPGDSAAVLTWKQSATAEHYASYDVLRSADGGVTFEKVNEHPVTPMDHPSGEPADVITYRCKLADNTTSYLFKIRGHSPFGFDGPATPADTVQGKPKPLDAPIAVTAVTERPAGMEIAWEFPVALNGKIQGFRVLRAPEHEGEYAPLHADFLPAASRIHTDPDPGPTNYYKVEFTDLNGNEVLSLPRLAQPKDSIPPLPPGSVQGEAVGKDGVLKIRWSPSTSPDVMGYRVFMADRPGGEYGQITTRWTKDTVFFHKANAWSLAEHKYFRIRAIDFRENSSDFSPECAVALPDIVPPAPPVMKKTEPTAAGVLVTFAPGKSKDVQSHRILRKKKQEVQWQEVAVLDSLGPAPAVSWLDTTAETMHTYDYMVQAVDDAGLKSNSKVFPVKPTGSGVRPAVQELELKFSKPEETIQLKWTYHNAFGVAAFVIYRGTEAGALYEVGAVLPHKALTGGAYDGPDPIAAGYSGNSPVSTQPGNGQLSPLAFDLQQTGAPNTTLDAFYEYRDKAFLRFKTYYYAIGVRYADGSASPLSAVQTVSAY